MRDREINGVEMDAVIQVQISPCLTAVVLSFMELK